MQKVAVVTAVRFIGSARANLPPTSYGMSSKSLVVVTARKPRPRTVSTRPKLTGLPTTVRARHPTWRQVQMKPAETES